jgi:hypothetical protein
MRVRWRNGDLGGEQEAAFQGLEPDFALSGVCGQLPGSFRPELTVQFL